MTEYPRVLAVKETVEGRLRTLPGVHAVGIGRKVVAGKPEDDLAIAVFLVEKKPLDRLAPQEIVPPEIDGVLTDVVEMAMPRLTAADPSDMAATVSADQRSVSFSGREKPGEGLLILLTCTSGPVASPPGPISYVYIETQDWMNLKKIALTFQQKINGDPPAEDDGTSDNGPLGFTAEASGTRVTLKPNPGNTCAITACTVTAVDDNKYFKDYIRGGIQIEPGGEAEPGTLGCIATTAPTAEEPQGKVVALTCQHVVAQPSRLATNLTVTNSDADKKITFGNSGTQPILPDSLVVVIVADVTVDGVVQKPVAFYGTRPGDTLVQVATQVAAAISGLGLAGLTAAPQDTAVLVTGGTPSCTTYGPPKPAAKADLHAHVNGLTIELSGEVSDDDYGIYTNINTGGLHATFGVYTRAAKGATLSDLAKSIAQSIHDFLPEDVRGNVTANPAGTSVVVENAQEVECIVKNDCRVGQPVHSFCSRCSPCCSDRIGRVLDARIHVDTALIELDAGQKYKPEIPGVGLQKAPPDLQPGDYLHVTVWKKGRTTSLTKGFVDALNVSGVTAGGSTAFHRRYTNAMRIAAASTGGPFALAGDSGAAVFTPAAAIVGILFSSIGRTALMTPIGQVTAAFLPALALNFAPAPAAGHAPGDVRTVPASAMAAIAAMAAVAPLAPAMASPAPFFSQRLVQVKSEITATPAGSEVAAAVERHFAETHRLVTTNRRVAAVWRRSGGPQIVQAVLDLARRRDQRLPEEIAGRPIALCLERLQSVLTRYASPALAADLSQFGPRLVRFSGLTYQQMLSALESGGAE
jgi:hypothetical protein